MSKGIKMLSSNWPHELTYMYNGNEIIMEKMKAVRSGFFFTFMKLKRGKNGKKKFIKLLESGHFSIFLKI